MSRYRISENVNQKTGEVVSYNVYDRKQGRQLTGGEIKVLLKKGEISFDKSEHRSPNKKWTEKEKQWLIEIFTDNATMYLSQKERCNLFNYKVETNIGKHKIRNHTTIRGYWAILRKTLKPKDMKKATKTKRKTWSPEEVEILKEVFLDSDLMKTKDKCKEFNRRVIELFGPSKERTNQAIQVYWGNLKKELESTTNEQATCPNCKEPDNGDCKCMQNKCRDCDKPVGNVTFTLCDGCWEKKHPIEKNKEIKHTDVRDKGFPKPGITMGKPFAGLVDPLIPMRYPYNMGLELTDEEKVDKLKKMIGHLPDFLKQSVETTKDAIDKAVGYKASTSIQEQIEGLKGKDFKHYMAPTNSRDERFVVLLLEEETRLISQLQAVRNLIRIYRKTQ